MPSSKETLTINKKGFALMHQLEPALFWTNIVQGVFEAVAPFIPFFFTARILDYLLQGTITTDLGVLVAAALATSFLTSVVNNGLTHYRIALIQRAGDKKEMLLKKKIIHMDYLFIEDTSVQEQHANIQLREMTSGFGMFRIFTDSKELIRYAAMSIVAGMLLMPLLTSKSVVNRTPFSIDGGWVVVTFFALLVAYLSINLFMNQRTTAKTNDYLEGGVKINAVFGYMARILENIKSGKEIRLYKQQSMITKVFTDNQNHTEAMLTGLFRLTRNTILVSNTISYLILALGYLYIIGKAMNGAITMGQVVQFAGSLYLFLTAIPSLLETVLEYSNNTEALKAFFDFLEMKSSRHEGTLPVEKRTDNEYTLEVQNVSFKYPGAEEYVLKDVSLTIGVGEKLAIVGRNGSGKTTFIKLLCRLYDPTEGRILLNGIDIQKYDYQEYLRLLSVVFQDFQLYAMKIGENVAASKTYDKDAVTDTLVKAGFSKRLSQFEKGLDTYLNKEYDNEGVEISGGEAQKVAMARALYKNAPLVILDEPTAALDPIAEFEMYTTFSEVVGNRAAIYISHRLSSVRFCDRVAVFHDGQLVQLDSHANLVTDQSGEYYELWNAQAQYYTKDSTGHVTTVTV